MAREAQDGRGHELLRAAHAARGSCLFNCQRRGKTWGWGLPAEWQAFAFSRTCRATMDQCWARVQALWSFAKAYGRRSSKHPTRRTALCGRTAKTYCQTSKQYACSNVQQPWAGAVASVRKQQYISISSHVCLEQVAPPPPSARAFPGRSTSRAARLAVRHSGPFGRPRPLQARLRAGEACPVFNMHRQCSCGGGRLEARLTQCNTQQVCVCVHSTCTWGCS